MTGFLRRVAIAAAVAGCAAAAHAQQPAKVPRIGFLSASSPASLATRVEAFRQGLKELGYVEGKSVVVEYRWAYGKRDRLAELAAELARLKVEVIVTAGPSATRGTKEARIATPIVMAFDGDPVGSGFVASLARPGGNITGLSILAPEVSGKQIDVLKQIIPKFSTVAILGDSKEPGNGKALEETERAAQRLGLRVHRLDVQASNNIEDAFQAARNNRADALVVLPSTISSSIRAQLAALSSQNRLPAMYPWPEFVDAGGLMTYSVKMDDLYRRSATYVDKILKGSKPGELPVEQPFKFELVINLKAAKQIGLTIPVDVLTRADRVIE